MHHNHFVKNMKKENKELLQKIKSKNYKIGTDCSGIEAPITALQLLQINYSHIFSCDNDKHIKETIMQTYKPNTYYDNILNRNNEKLQNIDIYVCGFPCQSFSTEGKREGFRSKNKEGTIFFKCYDVIKKKSQNSLY